MKAVRKFSLTDPDGAPVGTVEGRSFDQAAGRAQAEGHEVRGFVGDSTIVVSTRGFCEFEMDVPDEFGMACSEPELGVPTTLHIECSERATRKMFVLIEPGPFEPEGATVKWLFCDHHASQLLDDIARGEALGMELVSDEPVSTV